MTRTLVALPNDRHLPMLAVDVDRAGLFNSSSSRAPVAMAIRTMSAIMPGHRLNHQVDMTALRQHDRVAALLQPAHLGQAGLSSRQP